VFQFSLAHAQQLDIQDELQHFRAKFHIPVINGKPTIYFTGNSLGLQPKNTQKYIENELEDWKNWGVEGHFHGKKPWFSYHHFLTEKMAKIVGAKTDEIAIMNSLTTNLHLLMVSFYRPTAKRYKILMEGPAFCSDHYAMRSQARYHGFNAEDAIIYLEPKSPDAYIETDDVLATIEKHKNELAVVMLGGVNYYNGQFFELEKITKKAHEVGAFCGFDLAHAAGNVQMQLHNWGVDFACWCSYKYLNSGPGGVSGLFVHEKHDGNPNIPRFEGWWGFQEENRFEMPRQFKPMKGASAWQLSNVPVLLMASLNASLDIFIEAGMDKLCAKSELLTNYLEFVVDEINKDFEQAPIKIITPREKHLRGCQISLLTNNKGEAIFKALSNESVIVDWRKPNVIRMAPVPLYNRFEDVYRFGEILKRVLGEG